MTALLIQFSLIGNGIAGIARAPCRGKRNMRRLITLVVLVALVASTGCTLEDKQQLRKAWGDVNGDNTKDIAPISPKKSDL